MAEAEAAPDELSGIGNVMPTPPMPFLPAEVHGRPILLLMLWTGAVNAGQRALAPFRALAAPMADMVRPDALRRDVPARGSGLPPGRGRAHGARVGVDAATVIDWIAGAPGRVVQLRVLGGAMARVPAARPRSRTATHGDGQRRRDVLDPADGPDAEAEVAALGKRIYDGDGAYAGFLRDEGEARVRAAYPRGAYERLAAVKAEYDPDNVFRLNQNVAPG